MSGGLELPGGPGSRAAREEEARLPITRATPGVHQGVEAEAASEAPSRRGPAPTGGIKKNLNKTTLGKNNVCECVSCSSLVSIKAPSRGGGLLLG